jgi:DNA segregation ATPase FtsK/SpoIIIE, S-DNA-T family
MARAAAQRSGRMTSLLPPEALAFLRRRIAELAGVGLVGFGFALLLALASYDPSDPSLNHATRGPVHNLVGLPGAYVADILLQPLGFAATLIGIVAALWGWRLAAHKGVRRCALRAMALVPLLLAATAPLAALPAPAGWPLQSGLGGFVGVVVLRELSAFAQSIHLGVPSQLVGLVMGIPAAGLFVYVIAFSFAEWSAFLRALVWLGTEGLGGAAIRLAALGEKAWAAIQALGARREERFSMREPAEPAFARGSARRSGDRTEPSFEGGFEEAGPVQRAESRRDAPAIEPRAANPMRRKTSPVKQASLDLDIEEEYQLPPLDILSLPADANRHESIDEDALAANARLLESVLEDFGVRGKIVKVRPGPVVALYELEPAPGTKSSRVISLSDDIARSMSAISVRVAVVPGRNVLGIELPNARRETVYLRELLASETYERTVSKLTLVLGKDIGGSPVVVDLARMPHLLVAGTTGSGKSVAVNTMILSLLYRLPPSQCRFIMIDPKMLELSVYDGIPHLLAPVVTEPKKAVVALKWTVREMENRYRAMSTLGVRNITGYNQRLQEAFRKGEELKRRVQTGFDAETGKPLFEDQPLDLSPLPFIVVVVDEFADLMLVAGKDIEGAIQRLSQMARAAGIHLIMATQRPSVDVITGTIKANFPTRVSFQVTSRIDSRTILGESGAEQLLGQGDMLYMAGGGRISRVHGPFVRDDEVEKVVRCLKVQGEPDYVDEVTEDDESGFMPGLEDGNGGSGDELYDRAVALVCRERKASTSFVQRHLQIGYNRAARIIERMEQEGVVSAANHVGKREVLGRNIEDADD